MKKTLFSLCLLSLVVAGCQQFIEPDPVPQEPAVFVAEMEEFEAQTKTSLDENRSVVWSTGDQVAIFQGSTIADKYQVWDSDAGNTNAHFSFVKQDNGLNGDFMAGTETTIGTNVAIYPYESDLSCAIVYNKDEVSAYSINNVTIPSVQNYAENSFPNKAFTMVALTGGMNDHTLKFKNVCGTLKLLLKGEIAIKTIELKGNNEEELSGNAVVNVYQDGSVPTIAFSKDASKTITLDCGEGIQLSKDVATTFMMAVPPTAFSNGFTLTITDTEGKVQEMSTNKANPIKRSVIRTMPELEVVTKADPYIWFNSQGDNTKTEQFEVQGGEYVAELYTNVKAFEVVVPEDDKSWVTANVWPTDGGKYVFELEVAANPGGPRSTTVRINAKDYPSAFAEVAVNQDGTNYYLSFDQSSQSSTYLTSLDANNTKGYAQFYSNMNIDDMELIVPEEAQPWLSVNMYETGSENTFVIVSEAKEENLGAERRATITVRSKQNPNLVISLSVSQAEGFPYIWFNSQGDNTKTEQFEVQGGEYVAELYTNVKAFEVVVPDDAKSWVTANVWPTDGGKYVFELEVAANPDGPRSTTVRINAKDYPSAFAEVAVNQDGTNYYLSFDQSSQSSTYLTSLDANNTKGYAQFYSNMNIDDMELIVPEEAQPWLSVNMYETGSENTFVIVSEAKEENLGAERRATITVRSKQNPNLVISLSVSQAEGFPYIWFNSQGDNTKTEQFEVQGGEYVAELYTNVKAFEVVVPDDAKSWVTANVWPTDGGKYVFAVQVAASPGDPRSTIVKIKAKGYDNVTATLVIEQRGIEYYLETPSWQHPNYEEHDKNLYQGRLQLYNGRGPINFFLNTNIPVSNLEAVVNVDWLDVTFGMKDGYPVAIFTPTKAGESWQETTVQVRSKSNPSLYTNIVVDYYDFVNN